MNIVGSAGHRPWLPPPRPWLLRQTWSDLLFAHWPVPAAMLRDVVPPELEIDERDGTGWVAIVPFKLSGLRLRGLTQVPGLSAFPEINVRTYVTVGGRPGVYFFSLDADNLLGIQIARSWFKLNYYQARVAMSRCGEDVEVRARGAGTRSKAQFKASYRPCSRPFTAASGTLEHWLTERYCYYALDRKRRPLRCEIHHAPWTLQRAEARIDTNTMAAASGIELPDLAPHLLYARRIEAVIWRLKRC